MWSLFWYGFRYQKLTGALRHCATGHVTVHPMPPRVFNGRQNRATEFQKYCFLFSYSTVRYMAIARLCKSLQLRWRHWEYRHLACRDLSNIQETLPWLVRAWPSSGHLLASSSSTYRYQQKKRNVLMRLWVFGSGIHYQKRLYIFFALNAGAGFLRFKSKD